MLAQQWLLFCFIREKSFIANLGFKRTMIPQTTMFMRYHPDGPGRLISVTEFANFANGEVENAISVKG